MAGGAQAFSARRDVPDDDLIVAADADEAPVVEEIQVERRPLVAGELAE